MPLLSRVPGEVSESAFVEGPVYVCACVLSHVRLSATPRTIVHQAPLSMGSPRQEYWDGLPFPSPGNLPDPGIEPTSAALAGGLSTTKPPGKPLFYSYV